MSLYTYVVLKLYYILDLRMMYNFIFSNHTVLMNYAAYGIVCLYPYRKKQGSYHLVTTLLQQACNNFVIETVTTLYIQPCYKVMLFIISQ